MNLRLFAMLVIFNACFVHRSNCTKTLPARNRKHSRNVKRGFFDFFKRKSTTPKNREEFFGGMDQRNQTILDYTTKSIIQTSDFENNSTDDYPEYYDDQTTLKSTTQIHKKETPATVSVYQTTTMEPEIDEDEDEDDEVITQVTAPIKIAENFSSAIDEDAIKEIEKLKQQTTELSILETTKKENFSTINPVQVFRGEKNVETETIPVETPRYNFTDEEIDAGIRQGFWRFLQVQSDINCTEYSLGCFGIGAVRCVFIELKNAQNDAERLQALKRIQNIAKKWLIIYIMTGIPLWCFFGLCCCCYCCRICSPYKMFEEERLKFEQNPPGVLLVYDKDGQPMRRITYRPTEREKHLYKKLEERIILF